MRQTTGSSAAAHSRRRGIRGDLRHVHIRLVQFVETAGSAASPAGSSRRRAHPTHVRPDDVEEGGVERIEPSWRHGQSPADGMTSGRTCDVHHPEVAFVFAPREIQVLRIGRKELAE